MLHLERVNGKNIWDILRLKVADSQRSFVAGNDISVLSKRILQLQLMAMLSLLAFMKTKHRSGF